MKNRLGGILLVFFSLASHAAVVSYSTFKSAYYEQTNSAPASTTPIVFGFGARLITENSFDALDATVTVPGGASTYGLFQNGSTWEYVKFFPSKSELDLAFPFGTYLFEINFELNSGNLTISAPELYSTIIPSFTSNSWNAMQAVAPENPVALNWNTFTPHASANSAFIFIRVMDINTGESPFSGNLLPASTTGTVIPANTLKYGTTYHIDLIFSNRKNTPNAGFSPPALGTVGFDNVTAVHLITIPPTLEIALAGADVIVSWPTNAPDFLLESNGDLTQTDGWNVVTDTPVAVGNKNTVTFPVSGTSRFFRLHNP